MIDFVQGDSAAELRSWLTERVAFYLDRGPETIRPDVDLAEYGVDSVYALSVVSDIEDRIQQEVDLGAARLYPTIDALVGYLMTLTARRDETADPVASTGA
ncbi:acyl carrier protein [Micromonospora sp. CA-240977]|uniref:acyl carrier protein n=1 Tax=Micromonospora sp. CA-240977 TaxID=3239957 RepID=UPI003D934A7B